MDSLTQIVLGAACGEATLGKKIGNKAMLFGAIGGTIPDLDVIVGRLIYRNEIHALVFHRGFMHSFLFAFIGAFAFGWLVFKLYDKGKRTGTTVLKDWIGLFFWALFTHPILDSFTPYGTQLFAPFSNYKVAFNNIAVVDPLYTVPFIVPLIMAMFYKRTHQRRRHLLFIGVGLSSIYMIATLFNENYVETIFEQSLKDNKVMYERFQVQPTIFNNVLWYGVAETRSFYYFGFFSHFDKEKNFKNWARIEKHHGLLPMQHKDLALLAWFSNDYYNITATNEEDEYIFDDLRYPLLNPDDASSTLFSFTLIKRSGRWDIKNRIPKLNEDPTIESLFGPMFKRLKGE
ncbi:metal-dependent hydrolase [Winogradskyella aurantia]|uniref:Metal-dependent hydrolase n=1 Tax=Winogradskyella aurantia TaxID=1915063 RepID=A0A265UXV5_9FLAO|nr:metal-dependent hydrolase [Winogradskyella aurantia]OZV70145.1 metal-dependent hydrolase [Winogradskyella aurantia]